MNDYTEYTHGIDAAGKILNQGAGWTQRSLVLRGAADYMQRMRNRHIFAASFCENDDLLSQWRGYAEGGMAFGFIHDDLIRATSGQSFHLYSCIYKDDEKEEIIRAFIDIACPPGGAISADIDKDAANLGEILLVVCAFFKDESFHEEQEWRLVSKTSFSEYDQKRGFRSCGKELIPYYKIDLGPHVAVDHNGNACLPFDEMVAGPGNSSRDKETFGSRFHGLMLQSKDWVHDCVSFENSI